ncbi:hypothetical protein NDU88_005822 [Pleurodeles waltl]|uniref:Uncharacterized protein n=1 Tax=Pleurodeles waltl TaxID=8319 RepID=A0AAV7RNH3_PLEWA|nr:hypothetical protein NDU88_005822 [Pleurodeles waltl]
MLPQSSSRSIRSRAGEGRSQAPRPPSPLQLPRGRVGPGPQHAIKFKFSPAGGSRGPGPPPRPQPGTASRPGGQGGLQVLRVTLAPLAPARRHSPRVLLYDRRGGGSAGAPAAGIHPPGAPQPSPGLSPPNLNFPQQEDPGGQGLRHGPSPAPQAAQAVREGSRSSGSHSRFARRCGAAHPAPPPRQKGGAAGAPAAGIHPRGAPQLSPGLSPPLDPRQTTSSGPQSPPQIRRAQLAAPAILSSSSREQPGRRMRVSRRLFINSSHQTSLQVPGTPGRHV